MKNFINKINYRFKNFMAGRNGYDTIVRDCSVFALILMVPALFRPLRFLWIVALVIYAYTIFRMFSKNIASRRKENAWYVNFTGKIKSHFSIISLRFKDRKKYKYRKCPVCKSYMRLKKPEKGGINVIVTCTKCRNEFKVKL